MLKILWTWDRGKCLSFLNIWAYYCQFIMSRGILWRDAEHQTLLVRVWWQSRAKLLSGGESLWVINFQTYECLKKAFFARENWEINHYVASAGLCDMLICFSGFVSFSFSAVFLIWDFFHLSLLYHSQVNINNYHANNNRVIFQGSYDYNL